MVKYIASFFILVVLAGAGKVARGQRDVTFIIAADLHFDFLPETDQYYHVVAMNRVPGHFVMPDGEVISRVDGVVIAGDIFDRSRPEIIDLYRQRYERGEGERRIHFPVYPGLGNHDLDVARDGAPNNEEHLQLIKNYLDSLLAVRLRNGEILNWHPSSRSYSWNAGDVHFVHAQRYAGDTSYCESNLEWLKADLQTYASNGEPVVYIQHYGTDPWVIEWWPREAREELFDVLDKYNVAAFFAGHTHTAMMPEYRGYPIYEVNNAWKDEDGNGSFAVLRIKDDRVTVASCRWKNGEGELETVEPVLNRTLPAKAREKIHYNAFSHNDYWRRRPLEDALSYRFNCVEADLWLIDGDVYVGHSKPFFRRAARTFENMYLKPLVARIEANGGKVYPGSDRPFFLMVEFKSDAEELYRVLKEKMEPYRKYFCSLDEGEYREGAVLLFISGKRPTHVLSREQSRFMFLDGMIRDLGVGKPTTLIPVVSDHYSRYFTWRGRGKMPEEEYRKMKEILDKAHGENKLFRWWGEPERKAVKKLFLEIGVDLVGTDDLRMLRKLLE